MEILLWMEEEKLEELITMHKNRYWNTTVYLQQKDRRK